MLQPSNRTDPVVPHTTPEPTPKPAPQPPKVVPVYTPIKYVEAAAEVFRRREAEQARRG